MKTHRDTQQRESLPFQATKTSRVYERIAMQIEHAIFQRRLRLGDKLPTERELADQFSASRVAVREALRALHLKGLLEVRKGPGGGHFVRRADSEVLHDGLRTLVLLGEFSVMDLAEVRIAIEPAIARAAAIRSTERDHTALTEILNGAAEVNKTGGLVAELEFHRLVAKASKNPLYVSLLGSLMSLEADLVISKHPFGPEDHAAVDQAHREILDAIIAKDGALAEDAMRRHALDLRERKLNID